MIEQEYRAAVDAQHAPEALIRRTLACIEQEQQEKPKGVSERSDFPKARLIWLRRLAAAAACLMILAGVGSLLMSKRVVYARVGDTAVLSSGTMNFGLGGQVPQGLPDEVQQAYVPDDMLLPQGLTSGRATDFSGYQVYLGENKTTLYAAYEEGNGWVLLYSTELTQKEFTAVVKAYFAQQKD